MSTKGQAAPVKARVRHSAIFIAMAAMLSSAQAATNLYVSTSGNATNDCLSASNACTLYRARDVVRTKTAAMSSDIVVNIAGGNYALGSTLQLTPEDSGQNGYSVIYQGPTSIWSAPATLNGGITLPTGNSRVEQDTSKHIWRVPVPAGVHVRQLYVNGVRAVRARHPNETNAETGAGYLQAVSTVNVENAPTALNFVANTTDVPPLQKPSGAEVVWIHHWKHLRARLGSIVTGSANSAVTFQAPENTDPVYFHIPQSPAPYYFENDYKLLDAQGEWYFDPAPAAPLTTPQLYFIPRWSEAGRTVSLTVPQLETLVEIAGTSTAKVHHVKFKNLTFANSNWNGPSTMGYGVYQGGTFTMGNGEMPVPGAVSIKNADTIALENNVFTRTGAHALLLTGTVSNYRVVSNQFKDLSGGGVYDLAASSSNGLISNNLVENHGRAYADGVGILARYPNNIVISHNTVRYGGYTGISLGDFHANQTGNQVLNNEIYNVMRVLDDGAGIYTFGLMTNTLFQGNFISDIKTSTLIGGHYPAVGIYLDQTSNGRTVQGNVVRRASQSFKVNSMFDEPANPVTANNLIAGNYYTTVDVGATSSGTNIVRDNIYFAPGSPPSAVNNIMGNAGVQ